MVTKDMPGALDIVRPFCSVVINEETIGPITGLAIGALDKFFASGLLDPSYDKAAHGFCEVAEAITHARFVGTSTASDEVVLMKVLIVPDNEGGSSLSGDSPTAPAGSTFTTSRGVHFSGPVGGGDEGEKSPHGMPCVREVLRFFISIINPKDRNDKRVICIGLDLVTVMLECGGKSLVDIKSLR
ncbi:PREDICTED: Golgi-specific brefeldin A-resistance guanine nucleotide exchange factor 1-like, partial [Amphimedon queenslandica]|uniref:Uncharacterized protein n=1 Tax=Amphimedon queenslandica TaxID=400682 RepID=A0AAN0JZN3_AMPQE